MRWLALALVACHAAPPAAPPTAGPDWPALARGDVLAAYAENLEHHAGVHDPANPGFRAQLARARDAGLREAARAHDRAGHALALGAFSAELADGHAITIAKEGRDDARPEWPGFVAAWRGEKLFVHHGTLAGAEITACNGMPIRTFLVERLRYRLFRPAEPGQWWHRATLAFLSTNESNAGRAERCTIGGRDVRLAWTAAPPDFDALARRATDGEREPIALAEPRPGIFLVPLPDFHPNAEARRAYEAMFAAMRTRHAELQKARAVILDLRHNGGGSSAWAEDAARALWGDGPVQAKLHNAGRNVGVAWRASKGNLAHVESLEKKVAAEGHAAFAAELGRVANGMRGAVAAGKPTFFEAPEDPRASSVPPPDIDTPVYVLTSGRCGSACLDAVDVFVGFPSTRLVGAPTSADSTYMEARFVDLPSGRALTVIPIKTYVNRPRASGQVYRPHLEVTDLDWSTKTFLDRIDADLASR